jgi:hypothetical protein
MGKPMVNTFRSRAYRALALGLPAALLGLAAAAGRAQPQVPAAAAPLATYADMVDLVEASPIVAMVEVRDQAVVEPARAVGVAAGRARLYIEGRTLGVLWGRAGLGQQVAFLADVPLLANGKPPKLKKQRLLLFGSPVPSRPGTLQLSAPDAYLPATPETEQLTRTVIAQFAAAGVPPRIKGVRDVMSVAGNLAGESETQMFVDTSTGAPVSLTVVRRPGMQPQWGVSWSEIVDQAAKPPEPNTLAWYRLACFLPARLPAGAYLQQDQLVRARADADYRVIVQQLGPCQRTRR